MDHLDDELEVVYPHFPTSLAVRKEWMRALSRKVEILKYYRREHLDEPSNRASVLMAYKVAPDSVPGFFS